MNDLVCKTCDSRYSLTEKIWWCHCGGLLDIRFTAEFFHNNPPQIKSYLFRRFLFSRFCPESLALRLRNEKEQIRRKIEINKKILLKTLNELRGRNLDFGFVIFHPDWSGVSALDNPDDWRDIFLKKFLLENHVPFIGQKASTIGTR